MPALERDSNDFSTARIEHEPLEEVEVEEPEDTTDDTEEEDLGEDAEVPVEEGEGEPEVPAADADLGGEPVEEEPE